MGLYYRYLPLEDGYRAIVAVTRSGEVFSAVLKLLGPDGTLVKGFESQGPTASDVDRDVQEAARAYVVVNCRDD